MSKEDLKIVFFGTPDFAVESLSRLVDAGYNVVAVVTMPDKPAGRGRQLQESDVKRYAVEHHLPVLQPVSLKDEAFIEELRSFDAQLFIVIAFRMLPEAVWMMPPLGTFNLHASLLPRYRGAAPINWAVMNGDTETGVTTFFLKHEIDTGDVIQQRSCPIGRKFANADFEIGFSVDLDFGARILAVNDFLANFDLHGDFFAIDNAVVIRERQIHHWPIFETFVVNRYWAHLDFMHTENAYLRRIQDWR